jgi:hypothetical protein
MFVTGRRKRGKAANPRRNADLTKREIELLRAGARACLCCGRPVPPENIKFCAACAEKRSLW